MPAIDSQGFELQTIVKFRNNVSNGKVPLMLTGASDAHRFNAQGCRGTMIRNLAERDVRGRVGENLGQTGCSCKGCNRNLIL